METSLKIWGCGILFFFSPFVFGQTKARHALIGTDGSAVYKDADFDSEVLTYLNTGEKVVATVKTYPGKGGIGLFFRIKTNKGVLGYVADTDLVSKGTKQPLSPLLKKNDSRKGSKKTFEEEMSESEEPLYFTRYLGVSVARKNHKIKHLGKTYSDDLVFFGLRGSGPGTLFDGPPLDFGLLVSVQSPEYYGSFAQNEPKGFMIFSDLLLQLPLWENKNHLFTYGLGFMALYSSYGVKLNDQTSTSKQTRIGGELGVGYSYAIQKFLVRADYKYQFERFQTSSILLSFQKEYR